MTTDQDLDAALALFNDGLERQKAERRAAKAIENAEKTKHQAAATLKRLQSDSSASPEDRAAAEGAYRDAVAAFNALRNGETPPADAEASPDDAEPDAESSAAVTGDEPAVDEPAVDEAADGPEATG